LPDTLTNTNKEPKAIRQVVALEDVAEVLLGTAF
jgi:hypothetical protein